MRAKIILLIQIFIIGVIMELGEIFVNRILLKWFN